MTVATQSNFFALIMGQSSPYDSIFFSVEIPDFRKRVETPVAFFVV